MKRGMYAPRAAFLIDLVVGLATLCFGARRAEAYPQFQFS